MNMIKKVLITGAAGFVGRYMRDYLNGIDADLDVVCTDVHDAEDLACDTFIRADISCEESVGRIIKEQEPDCVIHLAGVFGGGESLAVYKVNVLSMLAILEAAKQYVPRSVIVTSGSAAEYGRVGTEQLPIDESCDCKPAMEYGISKLLATQAAINYHRLYGINVTIFRPFQLLGKGVSGRLAPGAFARELIEARDKGLKSIKVGNLESSRDFLSVKDAVRGIWQLCQKPAGGEIFNLCMGELTKIKNLLDMMVKACGCDVEIEVDPERLRGNADVNIAYGSNEKIRAHCGWKPEIPLKQAVQEMFN